MLILKLRYMLTHKLHISHQDESNSKKLHFRFLKTNCLKLSLKYTLGLFVHENLFLKVKFEFGSAGFN